MKMIYREKQIGRLLAVVALLAAGNHAGAQNASPSFAHYKGVHGQELAANGMQQVYEYDYYYYVSSDNRSINLKLPFFGWDNETQTSGKLEPRGYFRWYDYDTDAASSNLTAYQSANTTTQLSAIDGKGLFAYDLFTDPSQGKVGVTYTLPDNVELDTWQGDVVACDVSRYTDYNDLEVPKSKSDWQTTNDDTYNTVPEAFSTFTHEPTLSIRYIFHILPAPKLADDIMNAVCTDVKGSSVTYEDNKKVVVGLKDSKAEFTIRLNLNDVTHYYFRPLKSGMFYTKHVFHPDGQDKYNITKSDFETDKLMTPPANSNQAVTWRIYSPDKTKYIDLANNTASSTQARFLTLSMDALKGQYDKSWYGLDNHGYNDGQDAPAIEYGQTYYAVAYLRSGDSYCPVASYELQLSNTYPMTDAELDSLHPERLAANIAERYVEAITPISFDADNDQLDLSLPTTAKNNLSAVPSKWNRRAYGFVYGSLLNRQTLVEQGNSYVRKDCDWGTPGYSPLHGEYGIYKTINLSGVSGPSAASPANDHLWWNNHELHDRTFATTKGAQSGSFIYFDASDESRKVATADFEASLCSGTQMLFSAYVADMTEGGKTQPEVMFRLFGVDRDENGAIRSRTLLQSFASGSFASNRTNQAQDLGTWYQVFGRMILSKNTGVENYTDFQLEIDNMCNNTSGADYAIDDIRLYRRSAIVDVIQDEPLCEGEGSIDNANLKFKLRGHFATLQDIVGSDNRTIYYRICKEDGTPMSYDYDGDGKAEDYGQATLPAAFDATNAAQFETDPNGEQYFIIANKLFGFEVGQKYYVSLATYDAESQGPGVWGTPSNVCSSYSNIFGVVKQEVAITDATGAAVTTVQVSCSNNEMETEINASLKTADTVWGGSVTLTNVPFDWYIVKTTDESQFAKFQEALRHFRDAYPEATALTETAKGQYSAADYATLKTYVYDATTNPTGQLVLAASTKLSGVKVFKAGNQYMVYAIPVPSVVTVNGVDYKICGDNPFPFKLRVAKNGPSLTLGYKNVAYPDEERTVRLGLRQIDILNTTSGELRLPIRGITVSNLDTTLVKKENQMAIYVSATNDPTVQLDKTPTVGYVSNQTITKATPLNIKFNGASDAVLVYADNTKGAMHEGYWYELTFEYEQQTKRTDADGQEIACPGETYVKFVVVPEYLTWNSSQANSYNSNWNTDDNWQRSSTAELFKDEAAYPTYGATADYTALAQNGYAPMRFSKVTIAEQKGKVYPDLGYIQYSTTNGLARSLANGKGEAATENIEYDLMVTWDKQSTASNHTDDGTNFSTEPFYGNTCAEIYFKPRAELREPCFLVYDKAYVEKELKPNTWSMVASPLSDTYAGELYVPTATGRQQTEAFVPVKFNEQDYSRAGYPIYQRSWDEQAKQTLADGSTTDAYDYEGVAITPLTDLTADVAYWSHVYNNVSTCYGQAKGFAVKAGDDYSLADKNATAIIRLPKADAEYAYYGSNGQKASASAFTMPTDRKGYELLVAKDATEGATSSLTLTPTANLHTDNRYYLIGNPYPATLSMYWFLKANTQFERKVWTLADGTLTAATVADDDTYNKATDLLIEPMQAFIVKVKDGEAVGNVGFTSRMNVDRWITTTTAAAAATVQLTATSKSSAAKSRAKVQLADEASADYDEDSDVETLHQSQLGDMPTVYTVASDKALAVNVQPAIDFLPLGVVSDDDQTVSLTLTKTKLAARLYLYDAKEKTYTEMSSGDSVNVEANAHGRYFLTTSTASVDEATAQEASVRCYSPAPGRLTVAAPTDGVMLAATIYTLDGRKVAEADVAGQSAHTFSVGKGLYAVSVQTASQPQGVTAKVSVR